ncbi:hypothetical protein B0H63DRAFT_484076 [Podospora didyma]|uniref:Transporter n=1 Tax=Podospora didyma TaxID=330526 RepID=A0AAE0KA85_9PEZI|nr:hypothetical protein B0H63DRAFT_484076 [Podospora didyma]
MTGLVVLTAILLPLWLDHLMPAHASTGNLGTWLSVPSSVFFYVGISTDCASLILGPLIANGTPRTDSPIPETGPFCLSAHCSGVSKHQGGLDLR